LSQVQIPSDPISESFALCKNTLENIGQHTLTMRALDSILDQFINDEDAIKGDETTEQIDFKPHDEISLSTVNPTIGIPKTVYAVDSSSIVLGQGVKGGVLFSIRVVVLSWNPKVGKRSIVDRFEVPGFVSNENKEDLYHGLRSKLWNLSREDVKAPEPFKMVDRIRNIYERYAQIEISKKIDDSILLVDGSLTADTVDTPSAVLEEVLKNAATNSSDVVAISKKTRLTTASGTRILELLGENTKIPAIVPISKLLSPRAPYRLLGEVYVGRLSGVPISFRIDVSSKRDHAHVFGDLLASVPLESGYPVPLIHAHVHCYYNSFDVLGVRAFLAKKRVPMTEEFDIRRILFGMYGGGA